jgi:hypothetical protein
MVTLWDIVILLKEDLSVHVLVVIAMAVVIIIESPFFNNIQLLRLTAKNLIN